MLPSLRATSLSVASQLSLSDRPQVSTVRQPSASAVPTSASTRAATSASRAARSGGTTAASRTSSSVIRMARPRPRTSRRKPAKGSRPEGLVQHQVRLDAERIHRHLAPRPSAAAGAARAGASPRRRACRLPCRSRCRSAAGCGRARGRAGRPGRCSRGRAPAARACRATRRSPGIRSTKGPPVLATASFTTSQSRMAGAVRDSTASTCAASSARARAGPRASAGRQPVRHRLVPDQRMAAHLLGVAARRNRARPPGGRSRTAPPPAAAPPICLPIPGTRSRGLGGDLPGIGGIGQPAGVDGGAEQRCPAPRPARPSPPAAVPRRPPGPSHLGQAAPRRRAGSGGPGASVRRPGRGRGGLAAQRRAEAVAPPAQQPPGAARREAGQPAARLQPDRFEDHAHAAFNMPEPVKIHGTAHIAGDAAVMAVGDRRDPRSRSGRRRRVRHPPTRRSARRRPSAAAGRTDPPAPGSASCGRRRA